MELNGISSNVYATAAYSTGNTKPSTKVESVDSGEEAAAVYEKSETETNNEETVKEAA